MVAWLKALLFAGGGLIAAGGTAYVTGMLDPWLARTPPVVAALPDQPAPESPATPPAAVETDPQPGDPSTTEKQPRLTPPTFDLLRVEPDGSMLIAGNATAGATIEVVTEDTVLGTSDAGAEGDFVVVLDDPLSPGDYQIILRATEGDETIVSEETAIVSIPAEPGGQVLAMVEQPGEPSRIITAPDVAGTEADEPAAPGEDVAAAPEDEPEEIAGVEEPETAPEEPAAPPVADAAEPETEAPGEEVAAAPSDTPEEPAAPETVVDAAPDTAGDPAPEAPAEPEVAAAPEMDDEPSAPEQGSVAPETAGDEPAEPDVAAAPEVADAPAPGTDDAAPDTAGTGPETDEQPDAPETAIAPEPAEPDVDVAAAPEPEAPEIAPEPAVTHQVIVEAVEIDGDTIFVAGQATPGRTVRVYANALYLGDARASEAGRFLVETQRDLPVGDYIIRADLLERDGTVLARAAVPFEREPGESIAAVAPQAPAPSGPETGEEDIASAPEATEPEPAAPEAAAPEPDAPGDTVAEAPEPGPAPADTAEAPAPDVDEPAAPEVAEDPAPSVDAPDVAEAPAPEAPAPSEPEVADVSPPAEVDVAPIIAGEPEAPATPPADGAGSEPDVVADAPADPAAPEEEVIAAAPPEEEPELTGPKLERVDGAVIIRRGDTLWRISRRVYGRGVRFSTIYLANQDQISDPDRIWPGQVFAVPEETPEGDTADMQAIGEQAVPPDTESKIIR